MVLDGSDRQTGEREACPEDSTNERSSIACSKVVL